MTLINHNPSDETILKRERLKRVKGGLKRKTLVLAHFHLKSQMVLILFRP